jgi:hypothetical protein
MYYTLREAALVLIKSGFLYKGKTVTLRTVKTMASNKTFRTVKMSEHGRVYIVKKSEIEQLAKQGS